MSLILCLLCLAKGGTHAESTRARMIFLTCSALMLTFMMLCLIILRHHLFLWAVFAPKYVFLASTHLIYTALHVVLEIIQLLVTPIARRIIPQK